MGAMKLLRVLMTTLALLFGGIVAASPASAAGSMQITYAYCYQTDDGAGLGAPFECDYYMTGAVGTVRLTSYAVNSGRLKSWSYWSQSASVTGYGTPETTVTITVTFTDSTGARATSTNSLDVHWSVYP
jgi:hypothetical protein